MASSEWGGRLAPYSLLAIRHSRYDSAMKLDLLTTLNTERAARRAAIVVTDVASGDAAAGQGRRRGARIRSRPCLPSPAAQRQERHGRNAGRPRLSHGLRAGAATRHHRRRAYQPGAGADRQASRLRRHHRRSAHRVCFAGALSRRESHRRVAGPGAAAARHRPLHRLRRAHPRSEDRRSRARSTRWRATVSISARSDRGKRMRRRVDRLKQQGLADADLRPHPCADRARHRRGVAGGDRGLPIMAQITERAAREPEARAPPCEAVS